VEWYNDEARYYNSWKAQLEAKLGSWNAEYNAAPDAHLHVPDWTQPAPEVPHHPHPGIPPGQGFDLTTPHAQDLGRDPDHAWTFDPREAETGLRVEAERGIDLVRSSRRGVDWIDPALVIPTMRLGRFLRNSSMRSGQPFRPG
jgi:hypothetical protein